MNNKPKNKLSISFLLIILSLIIMFLVSYPIGLTLLVITIAYSVYSNRFLIHAFKGNKAYAAGDLDIALSEYKKAIKTKSVNASIITGYIILELKCGNIDDATNFLDNVLNTRKFSGYDLVSLKVSKALTLYKKGKINDAISLISEELEYNKSTYIYETLTSLLIINRDYNKAEAIINEAMEYDENSNILKSNFGEVNFRLGNFDISEETFAELVEENITFIEPYFYYGILLKKKGEIERAKEMFEKALESNDSILTSVEKNDAENELMKIVVSA